MRKLQYITSIVLLFLVLLVVPSSAFPADSIYVESTTTVPVIDGTVGENEWTTSEEVFKESLTGLSFLDGKQTEMSLEIIILKNDTHIFFLIKVDTTVSDSDGSISVGVAIADKPFTSMASALDRKVISWNTTHVITHDLFFCASCADIRAYTPGLDDETNDIQAGFSQDGDVKQFEFSFPLTAENVTEDITITEESYIKFVINPYGDMYAGQAGHSATATGQLQISFEPRGFFQRPEAGIDSLTTIFIGIFALLISGVAMMFILSGRDPSFAEKTWVINVTEKMAHQSNLMEVAYYNSSFLSMVLEGFLLIYAIIATAYGFWAGWGVTGYILNGVPLILTAYALYDLGKRNENLTLKLKDQRKKVGVDMNSSPKLWVIPVVFLSLVLFMLVFIGIDVIT